MAVEATMPATTPRSPNLGVFACSAYDREGKRTYSSSLPRPALEIGDKQFFEAGLTAQWQLRPLTVDDMVAGFDYKPATWLLARAWPPLNFQLYVMVPNLDPAYRMNSPEAVYHAMQTLERTGNPYAHYAVQFDCREAGMAPVAPPPWPFDVPFRTVMFA